MFKIGFQAERSTTIDKPVTDVFAMVADFITWREWSPWICQEPDCPIKIQGTSGEVGHYQEWNGKRIGAGNMQIIRAVENEKLEYQLTFLKPWKSKAKVAFGFQEEGNGTKVVWSMDGSIPFFLFFMKKKMAAWVGNDYERGLAMLKDKLETGAVLSASDFQDVTAQDPFHYVGVRTQCKMSEIGPKMEADFKRLESDLENGNLPQPDFVLSIYNKFDFVTRNVDYVSGFGFKENPNPESNSTYEIGSVPAHKAIKVIHTGSYKHLGNAWSAAMGAQMALKKRLNKAIPMYEIYKSDPHEVEEKDLITSVLVPVK